ncbi:MAG: bifunctional UDP-N-acetylglucosamine diphosphorylase/glucosamine-1-phosphate N-acetyltransferase GlmU [Proteobacteria bacterium]|nr:bifunctional UDP-N-acetylglucosamine diphosphorylase/glucosamine-1-phosphate N-acetyltransferase GlmU [Pseudomonadota bacterium]
MSTHQNNKRLQVVILAAGEGKRMYSTLPKVLHPFLGKPILAQVIQTASQLNPEKIHVICGHAQEKIRAAFPQGSLHWIEQTQQLGTGHAVAQALPFLKDDEQVLVLAGDVPLISRESLEQLIEKTSAQELGLILAEFSDPSGLGRVIRDKKNNIISITEDRDCDESQKKIREIYSGILLAPAKLLKEWLPKLSNSNSQKEYYLTEIISFAVKSGVSICSITVKDEYEVYGINDRYQLITLERYAQTRKAEQLLRAGVVIRDPARFDLRGDLTIGKDVVIDVNVIFEGQVSIGNHCQIGSNVVIRNTKIGDNVTIKENCVIEEATIGSHSIVGPFARVRPETHLAESVHIGNFVEIKKSTIAEGSKVNHLSYVGDAIIGKHVNVGAGTITCNYDGVNKYQTIIEDDVFIGSDTQLIAPVKVGKGATIGAGATICKDAPADQLTISARQQKSIPGWKRPEKDKES